MNADFVLKVWESLCAGGCANSISRDGTSWTWTAPDRLGNGALRGRIYSHRKGELMRDAGGYKIAADGVVEQVPHAFAEALLAFGFSGAMDRALEDESRRDAFRTDDIEGVESTLPELTDDDKAEMKWIGDGCSAVMSDGTIIPGAAL